MTIALVSQVSKRHATKINTIRGRIWLGRWLQYCLEDTDNWTPDLKTWCKLKDYKNLGEYFYSRIDKRYDYLLSEVSQNKLRMIFGWRNQDENNPDVTKVRGYADPVWLAAIFKTRFLYIGMDATTRRRIGESTEDNEYMLNVQHGLINPLNDLPKRKLN
jgi:hypothetical protein